MILQDYSFLSSKISERVSKKLNKKILRKKPSSIIELINIVQNFWKETEKNPAFLSSEEITQLLRLTIRLSFLIQDNSFVQTLTSDDLLTKCMILGSNTTDEAKLIAENQNNILERITPEHDPEGNAAIMTVYSFKFFNYLTLDNSAKVQELEEKITNFHNSHLEDPLIQWIFAQFLGFYSWNLWTTGKIKKAGIYVKKALDYSNTINAPVLKCIALNSIGSYSSHLGDVDAALAYFGKLLEIVALIGNNRMEFVALSNISEIYNKRGELKKSIKNALDALEILEETSDRANQTNSFIVLYNNLCSLYIKENNLDLAMKYIQEAIEMLDPSIENSYINSEVRKTYMNLLVVKKNKNKLKEQLSILEPLMDNNPIYPVQFAFFFYTGKLAEMENQTNLAHDNYMNALNQAINARDIAKQILLQIYMAELYLKRFSEAGNADSLENVNKFLDNIIMVSKEQSFYDLHYKALLLKVNIEELNKNYDEAIDILADCLKLVNRMEKDPKDVEEKINEIENQKRESNISLDRNQILQNSFNLLSSSFSNIDADNSKKIDYEIYGLLVLSKSGLPLYSNYLDTHFSASELVISGLISAISSFSSSIFASKSSGHLKSIQHDDVNIILEYHSNMLLALICDTDTFEIRSKMISFSEKLNELDLDENIIRSDEQKLNIDLIFNGIFS
ncbi:tetratricopeptide repeat protein [Candidatus Lokiarchaeum ossiferum]|uniref:tetratricopeptide repeat protein n=1 Tax=Candidatus Lokiarchaeum ossiferum TaxID=2951803 RepID=UPI00352E6CBC